MQQRETGRPAVSCFFVAKLSDLTVRLSAVVSAVCPQCLYVVVTYRHSVLVVCRLSLSELIVRLVPLNRPREHDLLCM